MSIEISLNTYQRAALRAAPATNEHDLLNAIRGIVFEAGELAEIVRQSDADGKPVDLVNLREELGDILWHIPLMCRALDTDLQTIATLNIGKLIDHYPDTFSNEAVVNRTLETEYAMERPLSKPVHFPRGECEQRGQFHSLAPI